MNKLLLTTVLLTGVSAAAAAHEVARVLSSTPVTQQIGVPRQACTTAANANAPPQCSTQTIYENRTVGYSVVYEYAGKQYTVQMPQDPGPTLRLQVTGVEVPGLPIPAVAGNAAAASHSVDPVLEVQTTGVAPPYPYPAYTYYNGYPGYVSYYGSPFYPYWGPVVSLGFVGGFYGGRHFGGHGHGQGHGHRR